MLTVKAADCDFVNDELKLYSDAEKHVYLRDFCVNVAAGERPELRISSPWTNFNITNKAIFENINFSGEDLFAVATTNGA